MNKNDLALHDQQGLMRHKTKPNQTKPNQKELVLTKSNIL